MSAGEFLSQTVDVVEVPVRLVLVLLVELIFVEAFVVEARGIRNSRLGADLGLGRLDRMVFCNGKRSYVGLDGERM